MISTVKKVSALAATSISTRNKLILLEFWCEVILLIFSFNIMAKFGIEKLSPSSKNGWHIDTQKVYYIIALEAEWTNSYASK